MNEYRFVDLATGMSASFTSMVTERDMKWFEQATGDCNPLHTDQDFAVKSGFPQTVAYGLLTSAFYSTLVGVYLPGKWALLHGIDIEFRSPAFVGDELTVAGKVTHLTEAFQRIEIKASIVSRAGLTISTAKIRVGLRDH